MAVIFHIPGPLCAFTGGRGRLTIGGAPATVGEALASLGALHPGVLDRVVTEDGRVRPHVNVFVGRESIRYTGGLESPVAEGDEITILPAVSGG